MDNDLMARRLRPPSEPTSAVPASPPMTTPPWMSQTAPSDAPHLPSPRDEIPWDRPSDYTPPTDTAFAGEQAWDRPDPYDWDDSAVYDDRTAEMLEPERNFYGVMVAAPTGAPAASQALASVEASPEPTAATAVLDAADDPDDAFAPVLEDVFTRSPSAWHEPAAYGQADEAPQPTSHHSGDHTADAWQSGDLDTTEIPSLTVAQPPPEKNRYAPVEPFELAGRGIGPTPPPELFTEAPSLWDVPATEQTSLANDVEQLPHEPTFEQQGDDQLPAGAAEDREADEAPVGVTAEQAGHAYEAFTAEQQPEAPGDAGFDSAAVLEIEVPQPDAAAPNAGKPQQLVLRIELAIVDSNGRRVDPANVAVRMSPLEQDAGSEAPSGSSAQAGPPPVSEAVPEPERQQTAQLGTTPTDVPAQAFDEAPWPTDEHAPLESRLSESAAWLDRAPSPAPALAPQIPWAHRATIDDPLTALSAPPPPTSNPPPRQTAPLNLAPPSFAPPAFAPTSRDRDPATAGTTPATASESSVSEPGGEQREPRFRAPPVDDSSERDSTAEGPNGSSRRVALYTLGAGVVVVALVLFFLRMNTNII